jgi:hypothetical protein
MIISAPVPRRTRRWARLAALAVVVVVIAASCDFDGTWNDAVTTPTPTGAKATDDLRVVACVPSGDCVAAGRVAAQRHGGVWAPLPTPPAEISALACTAVDDCLGGWTDGALPTPTAAVYHFDGSTWTATNWPATYAPRSIACPSATACVAIGQNESGSVVRRWNGTTFSTLTLPSPTVLASGVSCSSTTFCLAVGATSSIGPWAARWTGGSAWTDVATSGLTAPLDRVSCQSSTSCQASVRPGPEFQLATWNGTAVVGGPTSPDTDFTSGWWSFSCGLGSPTRCFGIQRDSETGSTSVAGLVASSPGLSPGYHGTLRDIACATATNCVVVGTDPSGSHAAWHFDGVSWSADSLTLPLEADPHLVQVSCPTSTFCMAVGTYAYGTHRRPYALVWNGTTWAAPARPLPIVGNDLVGVIDEGLTCRSATFCAATIRTVDQNPEFPVTSTTMYVWNGTTWSAQSGEAPMHLVCFSTTSCIGLDWAASYAWNGTAITSTPDPALAVDIHRLSCATPTRCVALVGAPFGSLYPTELASWDGTTFTRVQAPAPAGQAAVMNDVSCVGAAPVACVAVGTVGPEGAPTATAGSPYVLTGDGAGPWTAAKLPVGGPGDLRAVSCPDTAECLAIGSGATGGVAHPGLVLAKVIDTWVLAPDLPASPAGSVRYETISCVPRRCGATGQQGPLGSQDAVAAIYRWSYPGDAP